MTSARGLIAWGRWAARRRGGLIDMILAAALTGGALSAVATLRSDRWVPVTAASAFVCTSSVAGRRRAPVLAALVAWTGVIAYQRAGHDTQGSFVSAALVLVCYSVGRRGAVGAQRRSLAVVLGYALAACTVIDVGSDFSVPGVLLTWIPIAVLPAGAGLLVEHRERMIQDLLVAEARLRDEQSIRTARRVAEERTRVARELHDVVAHCVSVMVIQAGAARLVARTDAQAARDALRAVASSGRAALADLRRVVGVLRRRDDEFAGTGLGLAHVDRLLEGLRAGGLLVRYEVDGEPVELPADLDLTAFRVIQEALTNVVKHAPHAQAELSITFGKDHVEVRIEDNGPPDSATATHGGHGLVGMRERVALHGGDLRTECIAAGGFLVRARLPLTATVMPKVSDVAVPDTGISPPRAGRRRDVWHRLSTQQADVVFAGAWLVALEIEAFTSSHRAGPIAANVAAVTAMALVGAIRRRAPFVFLAVVGALTVALSGGLAAPSRTSVVGTYTVFVGGYTIAAYQARRPAVAGLAVLLVGVAATAVVRHAPAGAAVGGSLMACLVWLLGRMVRSQRELSASLMTATTRLAAEREDRVLLALYDERARIARDLHRLVAQLVTSMVVQSQGASELEAIDGARAESAIRAIEETGRLALTQMRQMLGVLRNEHDPAAVQPLRAAIPAPADDVLLEAVPQ
jgi:signal transduction histidine kinase